MLGYLNKPEATKQVIDEDQFFHSGDLGYYDDNGRFYICDRLKELIKVKGFQVGQFSHLVNADHNIHIEKHFQFHNT